jgi:xanthine dehydrogenase large subunit
MPDASSNSTLQGALGESRTHDSAEKHVNGKALYVDDIPEKQNQLHAYIGQSSISHGTIQSMDLGRVLAADGVIDVITAADVPGHLDIGPVFPGDPLLVEREINHYGQPVFAVLARSYNAARRAAMLAQIIYDENLPVLDTSDALEKNFFVRPEHRMQRGDAESAIQDAPHHLEGQLHIGGQEHYYLEGQASLAEPTEDGGMFVHTSSQHPSEVQKLIAEVLGIAFNKVTVSTRRMGGGFGGKETQAAPWACIASLLAQRNKCSVKLKLARRDDMILTGKRHPFLANYRLGFDDRGQLLGVEHKLAGNCGHSPDLSDAIVDRAMFHCDNAYYLPSAAVVGYRCKTHTVSHTAFRGFGGPQGMIAMEAAMDDIARAVGKDPLDVRKQNFYGGDGRNITHYYQQVDNFPIPQMVEQLEAECDYRARRVEIGEFNRINGVVKRGMALTPVKFGISFTVNHLNQAGALIHIYTDGSIHLNHGGTEMGQGLYIKIAQIVADVFSVDVDTVGASAARTDKVPNTSPTAASSGTDINGMAALNAATTLRQRLVDFACQHYTVDSAEIVFKNNFIRIGDLRVAFSELVNQAYMNRVQLSATGFYRTPKIHYDRNTASGHPFYYYANGVACTEMIIDTLTGETKCLRADILHDVGRSINPAIDIGQIEGGYIQGLGWLTSEQLVWDDKGRLLSDSAATYKIPAISDTPEIFNVRLLENSPNAEATVFRSKAVGEPPLMLAISGWCAIRDAIASIDEYRISPKLDAPATPENVLAAIDGLEPLR